MKKLLTCAALLSLVVPTAIAVDIVHDAEYYILESQNGERWVARATVRE